MIGTWNIFDISGEINIFRINYKYFHVNLHNYTNNKSSICLLYNYSYDCFCFNIPQDPSMVLCGWDAC